MNRPMDIRLEYKSGDVEDVTVVKPPWVWRQFLVLDDGSPRWRYIALEVLEDGGFSTVKAAVAA